MKRFIYIIIFTAILGTIIACNNTKQTKSETPQVVVVTPTDSTAVTLNETKTTDTTENTSETVN